MFDTTDTTTDFVETIHTNASSVSAEESARQGPATAVSAADLPTSADDAKQDPLSYDSVKPADGVSFNDQDWEAFKTLAAEMKLSPKQVQKLADFESACAKRKAEENLAQKQQQISAWANETRALYGAELEQEITYALRAANTFGGPDLRALLEETGLGNHPVVIRTLSGIGRTISEDACPGGTPAAPQDKTFAEALYGKHN